MSFFLKDKRKRSGVSRGLNITPLIDINANLLFFLVLMNLRVRLERQRTLVEAHYLNEGES